MRGLLSDEALNLGAETLLRLRRQGLEPVADRVDEELLADGKTHGERIEQRGAECIPTAPVPLDRGFHVDQQPPDNEVGHSKYSWQVRVRYVAVPYAMMQERMG